MFKTKNNFSKGEIVSLIDKYSEMYFVTVDVHADGCVSIFIGSKREKDANGKEALPREADA